MKYYAGIGSRSTPEKVQGFMSCLAAILKDYTLRSGGAEGADLAFERGCDLVGGKKEIFLLSKSKRGGECGTIAEKSPKHEEAFKIAERIHPAWEKCSNVAKQLHARNVYQILGFTLEDPVEFVVCWTPKGEDVGGTRTAIKIAKENNIPVYNLALKSHIKNLIQLL